jgi:hypothetical protein
MLSKQTRFHSERADLLLLMREPIFDLTLRVG